MSDEAMNAREMPQLANIRALIGRTGGIFTNGMVPIGQASGELQSVA